MSDLVAALSQSSASLRDALGMGKSFDLIEKPLVIAGREARLYFVDGFIKDETMEKVIAFLFSIQEDELVQAQGMQGFNRRFMTYIETQVDGSAQTAATNVLSGMAALLIDGFAGALMIDARTYPTRGMQEPEDDRVLRGARDGFVETLIFNTALIRRRIRDPQLTMDITQIGDKSKTDVVLCYLDHLVDHAFLKELKRKIQSITIGSITLGQESLAECLVKKQWFNPFPKIRYTERPDTAAACVAEGKIIVIVDNSPAVMLLPTTIFDFVQDTNDFYFPPFVGTMLRNIRIITFLLTIFLTPVWYLLIRNPGFIPEWLGFLKVSDPNSIPIILQLLITEGIVTGLKLASLNTPGSLSNSFSVVGALILGEFAVQARWFVPEVLLYMAFVAIATFTQPSFELGYAFKIFRVIMLVLTALFNLYGFLAGLALMLITIAFTRTVAGKSYLYPLIPFNAKKLATVFIRRPISKKNS